MAVASGDNPKVADRSICIILLTSDTLALTINGPILYRSNLLTLTLYRSPPRGAECCRGAGGRWGGRREYSYEEWL